ncbi:hypothetical protein MGAS9429_Spy1700 [Streptococcus pyogenes MGAS9429]|uniref:Uncharacterized protein n=1 Tax=Streptococcus pyogenes serotype M12 (strain MGAS9429) TaxID=370551 RepID=Q1JJT6_STRPC|nr:hypothetical protein MGAS9429_Spy1700 [Streptococcus pyogenes MGAS9429]ABF36773.1 hypothetical protein MGAS2096_Spy1721 [Streptococcus pyogenes MGAS2096]
MSLTSTTSILYKCCTENCCLFKAWLEFVEHYRGGGLKQQKKKQEMNCFFYR